LEKTYTVWILVCPAVRIPCVGNITPGNLRFICALNNSQKKLPAEKYFLRS